LVVDGGVGSSVRRVVLGRLVLFACD